MKFFFEHGDLDRATWCLWFVAGLSVVIHVGNQIGRLWQVYPERGAVSFSLPDHTDNGGPFSSVFERP